MTSDKNKTKEELINELNALKKKFEAHTTSFEKECQVRGRTEEELRLAQVIIDNSPVVLFRRLAGEQPRLVYVSDNIRQMGYTPEDFIKEKISELGDVITISDDKTEISHFVRQESGSGKPAAGRVHRWQ